MSEITPTNMDDHYRALIDGTGPDPWGNVAPVSSRKAAREYREQRAALLNPIRVERIRAVQRIHRRARVRAFFHRRLVGAFMFLVIVGFAFLAGLMAVRFLGAS